ncbi:chaperone NapD [Pasteurella atlantica]|uniref:Chaperone NapD n=2 Tax=Pasteurellaceae TaxID=712 RepID=A0ACC6HMI4_9PAST|nr:chaperone NapD [Pasteurella atlantica]MDP8033199.1 chaperone NapD [Pasteurella atlantica]MDP8035251.1 chaperone NapD [Pasteurella atlantica]MDP8037201.1 chaperone NapD [Pasteurella atlantica]MDP8047388.1 chaperone NapD [Pasteurella atlantica]MDP8049388.1 chaperone NapD [Pasteurella atlantica]
MKNSQEWHVCGLVVQTRPENVATVKEILLNVANTEIPAVDKEKGKIVVVMQSQDQRELLENMENARNIEGVIAVSLVYHQQDDDL